MSSQGRQDARTASRRKLLSQGQSDSKGRALTQLALKSYFSAVLFDDASDDRKPTDRRRRSQWIQLVAILKPPRHGSQFLRWNTHSVVPHREDGPVGLGAHFDFDATIRARKLDRVGDQFVDHLIYFPRIGRYKKRLAVRDQIHADPL